MTISLCAAAGCSKPDPSPSTASAKPPPQPTEIPPPKPIDWAALPDGCYTGIEVSNDAQAVLAQLRTLCAGHLNPLGPTTVVRPAEGMAQLDFDLARAPACLRILAVAPGAPRMTLRLLSRGGAVEASAAMDAPIAVLDPDGPVCVADSGRYQVTVIARTNAAVALRVFVGTDEQ